MTMLKTRRKLLAGKIEAVSGVAETITEADTGIQAIDLAFDPDFKMYDRSNVATGTLSNAESIPGQKMGSVSFKAEMKGPAAVYSSSVKPAIGKYLRACGFAETVDISAGSEKVTYLPASTGIPTMTLNYYWDGILYQLFGSAGSVSFDAKIGEPIFASFKFIGCYTPVAAAAMLVPVIEDTLPPTLLNAVFTLDAFNAIAETFSIDMGNQTAMRSNVNKASGYEAAMITARKPTGKLDPEMVLPSEYDFMGKWAAGTTAALTIGPVGSQNYNKVKFTAPRCQYTKVGQGDRNGIGVASADFQLARVTGDDEVKIEFTK